MIKAYLISYFRSLIRNKATSFINIFGLSIGLASCFIILLFVVNELGIDRFQRNRKTVYRVITENRNHSTSSYASFLFGPAAKQEFPDVESFARMISLGTIKVKKDNQFIEEPNFHFADQAVFDLLTFNFLEGKKSELITNPNNAVISESMARKYFGKGNVIGGRLEVLIKGEEQILTVSGVFADLPISSSIFIDFVGNIQFGKKNLMKMLITYGNAGEPKEITDSWDQIFYTNLLKISEKVDISDIELKINKAFKKYQGAEDNFHYKLQRYDRIYLYSLIHDSQWRQGKLSDIYIFSATAFLILLIASSNYVVLSLAQSEKRAKEIGIRKVNGANFKRLTTQVLLESATISVISLPLAIGLAELMIPLVNSLLDKNLVIEYSNNLIFLVGILVIVLFISFISGLYISIYLNKFNPIAIFRGSSVRSGVRSVFLKSLVISQMVIFIALIISSITIVKQLYFVTSYNPGFDPQNVLSVRMNDILAQRNYEILKQEVEKLPEIKYVSAAANIHPSSSSMIIQFPRLDDPSKLAALEVLMVDYNYIETLGLSMNEGRAFSRDFPSDSNGVIINESAITELGLTEPIGKKLPVGTIIGVVKDFPIHNLRSKIPAAYLVIYPKNLFEMAVKTRTDAIHVIPKIEAVWKRVNPDTKFDCSLLSNKIEKQYQSERTLSKIIGMFTIMAILIATLGLFGLSTFIALIRTKEIGIRKVNGGTLSQMVFLFWKEMYRWTGIAFLISCPVAWYFMHRWLQNFAYRTQLNWWIFALAGLAALVIALLTVSWQAWRAASRNPVEALRYE